jgi:hypothetical protein
MLIEVECCDRGSFGRANKGNPAGCNLTGLDRSAAAGQEGAITAEH